jgi:acetylornithine deacetylase/succinyl-diaminopimelate desuccinylase-like protein
VTSPADLDTAATHASLAPFRDHLARRNAEVVATQIAVTEIAAPTGEEGARGAWIAERFRALRLDGVHTDDAGNVAGTRPGQRNELPLVICAHLDTVFPRDAIGAARRHGNRIALPGIGDNGRGLAGMLALAECIDGVRLRTGRPVRFVATTGEEGHGDLRGAKHHFAHGGEAFAAIALDGTGDERIVHRAVGSRRFRVTFDGPGGHSWSDFGVANPLHAAASAVAQLEALSLPSDPRTTLTVSRAGGGLSVNSIPQSAWFEADIRSTSAAPVVALETALRRIVESVLAGANATRTAQTAALSCQIELIGDRPAGEIGADHPLVAIARAATHLVGCNPEMATASTDANVPLSLGIPAIAIGAGGLGGDVHTTAEWYEDTDGARGIARALTIVVAAAR